MAAEVARSRLPATDDAAQLRLKKLDVNSGASSHEVKQQQQQQQQQQQPPLAAAVARPLRATEQPLTKRWRKKWVVQDTAVNRGSCRLFKWVAEPIPPKPMPLRIPTAAEALEVAEGLSAGAAAAETVAAGGVAGAAAAAAEGAALNEGGAIGSAAAAGIAVAGGGGGGGGGGSGTAAKAAVEAEAAATEATATAGATAAAAAAAATAAAAAAAVIAREGREMRLSFSPAGRSEHITDSRRAAEHRRGEQHLQREHADRIQAASSGVKDRPAAEEAAAAAAVEAATAAAVEAAAEAVSGPVEVSGAHLNTSAAPASLAVASLQQQVIRGEGGRGEGERRARDVDVEGRVVEEKLDAAVLVGQDRHQVGGPGHSVGGVGEGEEKRREEKVRDKGGVWGGVDEGVRIGERGEGGDGIIIQGGTAGGLRQEDGGVVEDMEHGKVVDCLEVRNAVEIKHGRRGGNSDVGEPGFENEGDRHGEGHTAGDGQDLLEETKNASRIDGERAAAATDVAGTAGSGGLFVCHYKRCGKVFGDAGGLRKHMTVHGEKQFVCQYEGCGKRFVDGSKLKRHTLIHTGEKKFFCPFDGCGKAFSLDFNRRSHMRTHSGESHHSCPVPECSRKFAQESKLRLHIASVHEGMEPLNRGVQKGDGEGEGEDRVNVEEIKAANEAGQGDDEMSNVIIDSSSKMKSPLKQRSAPKEKGERPYACLHEGCGKQYVHKYKLRLHVTREHPGEEELIRSPERENPDEGLYSAADRQGEVLSPTKKKIRLT